MMSNWKPKRFWKTAQVAEMDGSWAVLLDERELRTPAKAPLRLKTQRLAEAVAAEWDAQSETVDPNRMPVTRSANAAIDKLSEQRNEVIALLAAYGETDLLCYRAATPQELRDRQAMQWDPVIEWAEERFRVLIQVGVGVMHVPQSAETVANLAQPMNEFCDFSLAAFHDLVGISGSIMIALAVVEGFISPEKGWELSRLDESWQEEKWGVDEEARALSDSKKNDFLKAMEIFLLANS